MFICNNTYNTTLEIKKSKFIAYLFPYNLFESTLNSLKQEHPKAQHFVNAFRYINKFEQIIEGSSDDGEPRGTAGRPSLYALKGNNLINTGIIIIRYFGGIKLGTGGLVRAYSDAVNLVIKNSNLQTYEKNEIFSFTCSFGNLNRVEYMLNKTGIKKISKFFLASHVEIEVQTTKELFENFNKDIN